MAFLQGIIGQPSNRAGAAPSAFTLRGGAMSDLVVSNLQGRFGEMAMQGMVYSDGGTINALSANTITLTATTTPVLGVWNPSTSPVNLVILQAVLQIHTIAGSAVDPGSFNWATSTGNAAISTGRTPFNRKTLSNSGSQAKGMFFTALTGISNNLVVQCASAFGCINTAMPSTATCISLPGQVENIDGSLIVPPGGVLALLNSISSTTVSVSGNLVWAEFPL
jgi:hypothetical protein